MTTYLARELGSGSDLLTGATARAAALARANATCAGVSVPTHLRTRPDGVVTFDVPIAAGASLAEIIDSGRLGLGACVTVGVGVARALAAMHAQRVAHGDVSLANVVARGREVTLVDTMGALANERGTPGFAAPERRGGASPAADVYALGMLLREIAVPAALPIIEAWTAPLLAPEPADRPSAAHAARALERCAPSEPVRTPAAPVAAAMRAGSLPSTIRTPADRWWRAERKAMRLAPLAALTCGALCIGWGLVPAVAESAALSQPTQPSSSVAAPRGGAPPVATVTLSGPQVAAEQLTARRVEALARGDARALESLVRAGSAAGADAPNDVDTLEGLALLDVSSELKGTTPGKATVEVTSTLSGYSVGQRTVQAATVTALLELSLTPRGWLVERILPQP